jgi:hypothetical protein
MKRPKYRWLRVRGICIPLALLVLFAASSSAQDADVVQKNLQTLQDSVGKLRKELEPRASTLGSISPHDLSPEDLQRIRASLNQAQRELDRFKVIYGVDDRVDYEKATAFQRTASTATAALVERKKIASTDGGKTYTIQVSPNILCTPQQARSLGEPPEPFFDQPMVSACSGFKVGNNLVATAGHCIKNDAECRDTVFIFGYRIEKNGKALTTNIPSSQIYTCKHIIGGELNETTRNDWRLVELDRPILNAPAVKLRRDTQITVGTSLTVIGYPLGLPVKIADGAHVRSLQPKYFIANLDTYSGNSGSPVFNSDALDKGELLVEGVLAAKVISSIAVIPARYRTAAPSTGV